MSDRNWWKPEKLKEDEKNFLSNDKIESLDSKNDFGSYKIMRIKDDIKSSQIQSHNDIKPGYKVKIIKKLLKDKKFTSILDVGCGLGYTANELNQTFTDSSVTGIDISKDAITYANEKFSQCKFLCDAIDPANDKQIFKFDLITAFEFYPFTRTNSFQDQVDYINHLTKNISAEGALVVFQLWDNPLSLSVNYEALQKYFSKLVFKDYDIPIRKIGILIPHRGLAILLSKIMSEILSFFSKKKIGKNKIIIIKHKLDTN
mgnify:FL=1